jgi:hypothetical protein
MNMVFFTLKNAARCLMALVFLLLLSLPAQVYAQQTRQASDEQAVSEDASFRISAGVRAGLSLQMWTLSSDIIGSVESPTFAFEPAFQGAFHFTDTLALQAELSLSIDKVSYSGNIPGNEYTAFFESFSLRIPVLARYLAYKNPDILGGLSISVLAGLGFNIPLGDMKLHSSFYGNSVYRSTMPLSYIVGVNVNTGIKLGQGTVFADIRFQGDFAKTVIHDNSGTLALYTRNTVSISFGYEMEWAFSRKN